MNRKPVYEAMDIDCNPKIVDYNVDNIEAIIEKFPHNPAHIRTRIHKGTGRIMISKDADESGFLRKATIYVNKDKKIIDLPADLWCDLNNYAKKNIKATIYMVKEFSLRL